MKKLFSILIILCLALAPTALMEEEITAEPVDTGVAGEVEDAYLGDAPTSDAMLAEAQASHEGDADAIALDETNFPDPAFLKYAKLFDIDENGALSLVERSNVTEMALPVGVKQGSMLRYFPNLKRAVFQGDALRSLDVRDLPALTRLDVSSCVYLEELVISGLGLTTLDLSNNVNLKRVEIALTPLTALNVSRISTLRELTLTNTSLTRLDLSKNVGLTTLQVSDNAALASLNVRNCAALRSIKAQRAPLTKLDISDCALILPNITDQNRQVITGTDGEVYAYASPDGSVYLDINAGVTLVTDSSALKPDPVPPSADYILPATLKSANYTLFTDATYRLDPGDATGKSFKSSNKKIVTVDEYGVITPVKPGKAKITFKADKKTRTVSVVVFDPTIPTSITLTMDGDTKVKKGDTVTLTATLNDGAVSGIKWKSSNKRIATVNKSGVVTFKRTGKVTITATATRGGKKASKKFRVSK